MPINSFNLQGAFAVPQMPLVAMPGGGKVIYVYQDSSGNGIASLSDVTSSLQNDSSATVALALAKCRANRGDVIVCLPGHVETITATTWATVAGVSVIGMGDGDERPTFNWTIAGAVMVLASANFAIANCILNLAATAAVTVAKAISVTGAKNMIVGCRIVCGGAGGTQLTTIALELATGADRFQFLGNKVYAPADAAVVTLIKLTNAVDAVEIYGNDIDVGMAATTSSLITFTTAPTNIRIGSRLGPFQGNWLRNSITSSTIAITGIANSTGFVDNNFFGIENGTGANTSITVPGSMHLGLNYGTVPGKYGLLAGTVSG
jgi:hypothetical protein